MMTRANYLASMPTLRLDSQQERLNDRFRAAFFNCLGVDEVVFEAQTIRNALLTMNALSSNEPDNTDPLIWRDNVKTTLEYAGIVLAARVEDKIYSYSVSATPQVALEQYRALSQYPYLEFRQALGIAHHWICNIAVRDDINFWYFNLDDWIDAAFNFESENESPSCWIFDQARNLNGTQT